MKNVPLNITSGLPYERTFNVTLPAGRTWWTLAGDFEVLGQIREGNDYSTKLVLDLVDYMVVSFDGVNVVTITLKLPGAITRKITKPGYYDIAMSDALETDALAFLVSRGEVVRGAIVNSGRKEINV